MSTTPGLPKLRTFKVRFSGTILVKAENEKRAAQEAESRISSDTLQIDSVEVAMKLVRVR
jgi:hypothetical protein